jgi:hypothetical protein
MLSHTVKVTIPVRRIGYTDIEVFKPTSGFLKSPPPPVM